MLTRDVMFCSFGVSTRTVETWCGLEQNHPPDLYSGTSINVGSHYKVCCPLLPFFLAFAWFGCRLGLWSSQGPVDRRRPNSLGCGDITNSPCHEPPRRQSPLLLTFSAISVLCNIPRLSFQPTQLTTQKSDSFPSSSSTFQDGTSNHRESRSPSTQSSVSISPATGTLTMARKPTTLRSKLLITHPRVLTFTWHQSRESESTEH